MITPSNPKVKAVVEAFEKEIKMLTNNDAIIVVVFNAPKLPVEYNKIVDVVCKVTETTKEEAFNNKRLGDSVLVRHLIAFFAKSYGQLTYFRIAKLFGRGDHTSVRSAVYNIKEQLETGNGAVWAAVKKITEQLEQLKSAA